MSIKVKLTFSSIFIKLIKLMIVRIHLVKKVNIKLKTANLYVNFILILILANK